MPGVVDWLKMRDVEPWILQFSGIERLQHVTTMSVANGTLMLQVITLKQLVYGWLYHDIYNVTCNVTYMDMYIYIYVYIFKYKYAYIYMYNLMQCDVM